nr:hypothetical protein [Tanacetum cinerariifolium]
YHIVVYNIVAICHYVELLIEDSGMFRQAFKAIYNRGHKI